MDKDFKELRCRGKNKKGRECNILLLKYKILEDEMLIQVKCPKCNTFSILHLPFKGQNQTKIHENNQ